MALSRIKTWIAGETLSASDLNSEFNNIITNPMSLISPLTGGLDFDGNTLTLDNGANTLLVSSTAVSFDFTSGNKTGTPGSKGSVANWSAQTFTDNNTAGSGTAALWYAIGFQRPTLAASNASVTTTNAATIYIPNAPAAGSNQTIGNAYALFIDDGKIRIDASSDLVSATSAQNNAVNFPASTCTISGATTPITTATGVNFFNIGQPTLSAANAITVEKAATLYISDAPTGAGAGPCTITDAYAIWVDAGKSRLDGTVELGAALNHAATVTVASATTTNIGAAASNNVDMSGTTTITGHDSVAAGIVRWGRFTGVLTLTHNATSMILPGGANIVTAANDRYMAVSLGSGNWLYLYYIRASGKPVIPQEAVTIGATVAANALTITLDPATITFRDTTLSDGATTNVEIGSQISVVVPSGATLGTTADDEARLLVLAINNAGTVELAVVNSQMVEQYWDEEGLITTVAIDATADSADSIYSTTLRSNVAYRIVGQIEITETTPGTWAANPALVQSTIGRPMHLQPYRETKAATSGTTVTFTGIPAWAKRITFFSRGVSTTGVNLLHVQIGDESGFNTTTYDGNTAAVQTGVGTGVVDMTTGFFCEGSLALGATSARQGRYVLELVDPTTNVWSWSHKQGDEVVSSFIHWGSGSAATPGGTLTQARFQTADAFDGSGEITMQVE